MINNQQNQNSGDEKKFIPHNNPNIQSNPNNRSFSSIPNTSATGTKSFVAENLNTPIAPKKNLVFIRKGQSDNVPHHQHQNNSHRNMPKKQAHRKVTSEFATKKEQIIPPLAEGNIRIIPLGGVEGIGQNMTVVEYGNDIIVIDAGFQFKTEETPGIDFILPNTKYLEQRKGKVRALIITHGHLDHIGAIPFIMENLGNPPIYTREFGSFMIKNRQKEFPHLPELNIKVIDKNTDFLPLTSNLKIKFFGVTHAIPDSSGVIIETPIGDIIATGDVRVDNTNGIPKDKEIEQYKFFKNRKILLLMMDSTGVEKQGWNISEDLVISTIDGLVKNAPGRVII